MRAGKRPTRRHKKIIEKHGLNPADWLVTKNLLGWIYLQHRLTGKERIVKVV